MYKFDCFDSVFYGHNFSIVCDSYFITKTGYELHNYIVGRVYTKEIIWTIKKDDVLRISDLKKGVKNNG